MQLGTTNHDRGSAGMRYVYPVVSRRARGVSVGVNLNPNHACNWACVYCQVPGLVRGRGPRIDLARLERELRELLEQIVRGDFMERRVPEEARHLKDVAFSGDGEPTTSPCFPEALEVAGRVLQDLGLRGSLRLILITNGSRLDHPEVLAAIERLAELGGEIWFKLDSATAEGARRIHATPVDPLRQVQRLRGVARLCTTWIQTCAFAWSGQPPSEAEQHAYLDCLRALARDAVPVRGVLLYGLARPPRQTEGRALSALPEAWMRSFARRIEQTGIPVQLSP